MKARNYNFTDGSKKSLDTDYNGDGLNDIVYAAGDGVHVLLNQPSLTAGRPQFTDYLVYKPQGAIWGVSNLVAVDFSGDSRPDLIVTDERDRAVLFLENSCAAAPSQG